MPLFRGFVGVTKVLVSCLAGRLGVVLKRVYFTCSAPTVGDGGWGRAVVAVVRSRSEHYALGVIEARNPTHPSGGGDTAALVRERVEVTLGAAKEEEFWLFYIW